MATSKLPEFPVRTEAPLGQRHVSMSNQFARAAHGLSLAEKRVIACGLANSDSRSARSLAVATRYGGWMVRLAAVDYAEVMGITPQAAYMQLKDVAATLIKKQWTVTEGKKVSRYNWLSRMTYHEGQGWVELEFTHHTAPHVLGLQKQFTSYQLQQASALRSVYSWRLMEQLQSWSNKGIYRISVEEFCKVMDAKPSHKKDFGMLRRSVIEPAVKELTQKDGFEIEWKPLKSGRKVTDLHFTFKLPAESKQGRLDV